MTVISKTRLELTQAILDARGRNGKTVPWAKLPAILYPGCKDISGALLWKIANRPDYYPGEGVCRRLGIIYMLPAPACPVHGVVHCYNCATQQVKPVRKRTPGPRRPRIAIRLDDPRSAARSIKAHMDAEMIAMLKNLLED